MGNPQLAGMPFATQVGRYPAGDHVAEFGREIADFAVARCAKPLGPEQASHSLDGEGRGKAEAHRTADSWAGERHGYPEAFTGRSEGGFLDLLQLAGRKSQQRFEHLAQGFPADTVKLWLQARRPHDRTGWARA